jgi:hypothetical protein
MAGVSIGEGRRPAGLANRGNTAGFGGAAAWHRRCSFRADKP